MIIASRIISTALYGNLHEIAPDGLRANPRITALACAILAVPLFSAVAITTLALRLTVHLVCLTRPDTYVKRVGEDLYQIAFQIGRFVFAFFRYCASIFVPDIGFLKPYAKDEEAMQIVKEVFPLEDREHRLALRAQVIKDIRRSGLMVEGNSIDTKKPEDDPALIDIFEELFDKLMVHLNGDKGQVWRCMQYINQTAEVNGISRARHLGWTEKVVGIPGVTATIQLPPSKGHYQVDLSIPGQVTILCTPTIHCAVKGQVDGSPILPIRGIPKRGDAIGEAMVHSVFVRQVKAVITKDSESVFCYTFERS